MGHLLPLKTHGDDVFSAAEGSLLLAKFVAHVKPDALDARALNRPPPGGALGEEARLQNHTLWLNAATNIGCGVSSMGAHHLADARNHKQAVLELRTL